ADIVPRELLKAAVAKKREEVSAAREAAKEGDSPQHQRVSAAKEEPKEDESPQHQRVTDYPWLSEDPWEDCPELAREDFQSWMEEFHQRCHGKADMESSRTDSRASLSTRCSSKTSDSYVRLPLKPASAAPEGGLWTPEDVADAEHDYDDSWELEFLRQQKVMSFRTKSREASLSQPGHHPQRHSRDSAVSVTRVRP
ncbi:unnamed protein product, partial [Symbiodinium sp. KB8]